MWVNFHDLGNSISIHFIFSGSLTPILGIVGLISQGKLMVAITGIVLGFLMWYFWMAAAILQLSLWLG